MYLTQRQVDILTRRHKGMTQREIAADLGISQPTVHNHLRKAASINGFARTKDIIRATKNARLVPRKRQRRLHRGVCLTEAGTYRAQIRVTVEFRRQKTIGLGTFRTEKQAIAARLEAERKYRGTN